MELLAHHSPRMSCGSCILALLLVAEISPCEENRGAPVDLDLERAVVQDATLSVASEGREGLFLLDTGTAAAWPGVTVPVRGGKQDLSLYSAVAVSVENRGAQPVKVFCRVDNPGADGTRNCVTGSVTVAARDRGELLVSLLQKIEGDGAVEFVGMRGAPPLTPNFDPREITGIVVFVTRPSRRHSFAIASVNAVGPYARPAPVVPRQEVFPLIDTFGQYRHRDWIGKTRSVADLEKAASEESEDLEEHPGPKDRNRYGGWTAGPQLRATGFFHAAKHRGRWWLVDPEGRLFWSHGVDCVRSANATPISDREHYYDALPDPDDALAQFYGRGSWAPHGYYRDRAPYRTYDFTRANLVRKYGASWSAAWADLAHRRLRSWGLNTIANWSDPAVYRMRRTPYTATLGNRAKRIEGSEGYWTKFPDVFDVTFRSSLDEAILSQKGAAAGDPWCIGFFVDNELSWGSEISLALASLRSPAEQPAKKVFLGDLRSKYETIERLNDVWGTSHASWDALRECREAPDAGKARADLIGFYERVAETYFRTTRDVIHEHAPGQLYLGCRFAWVNDTAARAAVKFSDVVSYNRYTYSVADLRLPDDADRPVIIGEFHFGALDRGMLHTGLRKARDQAHRAELYGSYVRGALRNPLIVGTHWFQFKDQATTGRGDGENYQIGFVDGCDAPYREIVAESRRVGRELYRYRLDAP